MLLKQPVNSAEKINIMITQFQISVTASRLKIIFCFSPMSL